MNFSPANEKKRLAHLSELAASFFLPTPQLDRFGVFRAATIKNPYGGGNKIMANTVNLSHFGTAESRKKKGQPTWLTSLLSTCHRNVPMARR